MSTSVNLSLVLPSNTTSLGALTYPLPTEVATRFKSSLRINSTICGRAVVGSSFVNLEIKSDILNLTFLTDPMLVDAVVRIAPVPIPEVTVENPGKE